MHESTSFIIITIVAIYIKKKIYFYLKNIVNFIILIVKTVKYKY